MLVGDDTSKNPYGVLVKLSDNPADTSNDPRFSYEANSIQVGDQSRTLWTKQNGLAGVCLGGSGIVSSNSGDLQGSYDYGRVVVFDAEGVAIKDFITQEVTPLQEKISGIEKILGKA